VLTINYSFFVQLAIFLAMVLFVKKFLFSPLLELWDERENRITGTKQRAEDLSTTVDRLIVYYEAQIWATRKLAQEDAERNHREIVKDQDNTVVSNRTEANEMIAELREKIASEFKAAQQRVQSESQMMGKTIAEKILGASISE
jgi:F-type H+-transporting ATPase subunit b